MFQDPINVYKKEKADYDTGIKSEQSIRKKKTKLCVYSIHDSWLKPIVPRK